MLGAMITFLAVCVIVAIYMFIVHSFLKSAEDPADRQREEREFSTAGKRRTTRIGPEPNWAH